MSEPLTDEQLGAVREIADRMTTLRRFHDYENTGAIQLPVGSAADYADAYKELVWGNPLEGYLNSMLDEVERLKAENAELKGQA